MDATRRALLDKPAVAPNSAQEREIRIPAPAELRPSSVVVLECFRPSPVVRRSSGGASLRSHPPYKLHLRVSVSPCLRVSVSPCLLASPLTLPSPMLHGLRYSRLKSFIASGLPTICSVFGSMT